MREGNPRGEDEDGGAERWRIAKSEKSSKTKLIRETGCARYGNKKEAEGDADAGRTLGYTCGDSWRTWRERKLMVTHASICINPMTTDPNES